MADGSQNLLAIFDSGQGSSELAGIFTPRRTVSAELLCGINITHSADLPGEFVSRHGKSVNLKCVFRVTQIYDLRGTMGLAFYWWGTGEDPEVRVGFILESPTGFWMSSFYDGPARLRYVFLPWGSFTWTSLPQPDLDPHHHGFNEPDKSRIDGFYWTVHTAGIRRVDYIYAPVGGELFAKFTSRKSTSTELSAGFTVRHSASAELPAALISRQPASANLPAKFVTGLRLGSQDLGAGFAVRYEIQDLLGAFTIRHPDSQDLGASFDGQVSLNLPAEFSARQSAQQELIAGFVVGQGAADLPAGFIIPQDSEDLLAGFVVMPQEIEDFEDAVLVDHYQHFSGTGYRNAVFPHTGSYSWRTPQGSNDIFDISNGGTLTYAKVTVWAIYGNATRRIQLLDSDLNVLAETTWGFISGYHQKSVEYTGAVKYFKVICPAGGNSGLWTDDIIIQWN